MQDNKRRGDQGGTEQKRERDFGDSAGYGGGGSTLDRDEVLGGEGRRAGVRDNPLDAVMDTGSEPADQKGERRPPPAGPHAKPSLTNPDATPGAGSLPSGADDQGGDVDPGSD